MDNISNILSNLSEQDIENLREAAQSVFSKPTEEGEKNEAKVAIKQPTAIPGIDAQTFAKISSIMAAVNREDNRCELLRALKPHLKPDRQHRADEAIRLLKIISILPMLREQNLM